MSYAGGFPAKKNAEFLLIFPIYDNDGDLVTGAADLDSEVSKDGGAFIDCANEAIEIGSSGIYKLTLTAEEMNADIIAIITKTTTEDAKSTATVIYTSTNQLTGDIITKGEAGIVDKIWDELKAGHTIAASFGDYLDAKITSVGAAAGAGAITWVYTLTDGATGDSIADADVWVSIDEPGLNVVASGKTDQYGKVTFYLDAGTVYIWRQKSGWDFENPDKEVVS